MDTSTLADEFIAALHALEAGEDGALERIVGLFAEDAVLTNAALKLADDERDGREGVSNFWENYRHTFREIRSEFHQITRNDEAVGLFWVASGRDAQGEAIQYDGATLLVLGDDGLISKFHGYFDTRQLSKTVGA
jgi:ketosteroid isomerase-like protein